MTEMFLSKGHRLRPGGAYPKTTITIHSTANPHSTALGERQWLDNPANTRQAAWHYCVDDSNIIHAIPDNEEAWHCGSSDGNRHSLSIEICESGNRKKAVENAAQLTAEKALEFGLSENEIVRHFDWSGKNCPRILIDRNYIKEEIDWKYFLERVKRHMADMSDKAFGERFNAELNKRDGLSPSAWSADDRKWAEENGIIAGDENGMRYKAFVTREELVAMLRRTKEMM